MVVCSAGSKVVTTVVSRVDQMDAPLVAHSVARLAVY